MYTSYFAKYKKSNGISIAISKPNYFNGESYPDLFPKWTFLNKYKEDHNQDNYIISYYNEVLNLLDPNKVYNDLKNNVLLCWEKSGKFCHRRIVAKWIFDNLNIKIPEI